MAHTEMIPGQHDIRLDLNYGTYPGPRIYTLLLQKKEKEKKGLND